MAKRNPINSDSGASRLRGAIDVLRWPFERVAWAVEAKLVWPLRERLAGWSPPRHLIAGALCAIAIGAVAVGAVLVTSEGGESEDPQRLAKAAPNTSEPAFTPDALEEPSLQGAPPVLGLDEAVATAPPSSGEAATEDVVRSTEGEDAPSEETAPSASASASSEPVAAGPDAMKVARRFAEAFVVYEVGEQRALARETFDETAAPALAGALTKRPPRQPENVKVPRAKVVNIVPGPRRGKAYSVSVALLRVGVTSELRLELRRNEDGWLVTDVRG
ncbi:MAG TPA: hypothetical protein VF259_04045 [Solirubrobacterales bacterium]